jgi:hypothetical protein
MKIYLIAIVFGIFLFLSACAAQNTHTATNAVAMPAASGDTAVASKNVVITKNNTKTTANKSTSKTFSDSDMVCKRKILTGSRFAKRVCMTRAEWRAIQELGQKTAGDFQSRGGRTNQPVSN